MGRNIWSPKKNWQTPYISLAFPFFGKKKQPSKGIIEPSAGEVTGWRLLDWGRHSDEESSNGGGQELTASKLLRRPGSKSNAASTALWPVGRACWAGVGIAPRVLTT